MKDAVAFMFVEVGLPWDGIRPSELRDTIGPSGERIPGRRGDCRLVPLKTAEEMWDLMREVMPCVPLALTHHWHEQNSGPEQRVKERRLADAA